MRTLLNLVKSIVFGCFCCTTLFAYNYSATTNDVEENADGSVVLWGNNKSGQLNIPANETNTRSISFAGAFGASGVATNIGGPIDTPVDFGIYRSMTAIRKDGTLFQEGLGYSAEKIPRGLTNVKSIARYWDHELCLRNDGTTVTWGEDDSNDAGTSSSLLVILSLPPFFRPRLS
jgi:hypothetical protein